MATILIIEDDATFSQLLEGFLHKNGFSVTVAGDIARGKNHLEQQFYDLLLLDYRLPDGNGLSLLEWLRDNNMTTIPIIMTSFHDVKTAVKTIQTGAFDYITKPVNPDELLMVIREAISKANAPVAQPQVKYPRGAGETARKLYEHIELVAPTDFSVIILGESGTGKELAARNIHELSKRKKAPFVALDCGALSAELAGSALFGHIKGAFTGALQNKRGLFEEADGGTLFLDEVGNLGYEVQVKLLRALQEREIQPIGSNQHIRTDVRIICATNDNLLNTVRNGKFREDLYHRLNEFTIYMPSLRERKEDISTFVDFFIGQTNNELGKKVTGVSDEVFSLFLRYDWPGNLRELKNIVKRAVLQADASEITTAHLPPEMQPTVLKSLPDPNGLKLAHALREKELILKALDQVKNNKAKAARLLKIDRSTLYYKMTKYKIDK